MCLVWNGPGEPQPRSAAHFRPSPPSPDDVSPYFHHSIHLAYLLLFFSESQPNNVVASSAVISTSNDNGS